MPTCAICKKSISKKDTRCSSTSSRYDGSRALTRHWHAGCQTAEPVAYTQVLKSLSARTLHVSEQWLDELDREIIGGKHPTEYAAIWGSTEDQTAADFYNCGIRDDGKPRIRRTLCAARWHSLSVRASVSARRAKNVTDSGYLSALSTWFWHVWQAIKGIEEGRDGL